MAKKPINERCPFQDECGRKKCEFSFHEANCPYYGGNKRPGAEIKDQEIPFTEMYGEEPEQMTGLTYMPIDELYPHPDNPRKDLGDLTELADSIKAKGVLQNLTVVRGHAQTQEEWSKYNKLYNENPSEELREKINAKWYEDGYTVIIGHRRMAAAKLAGLTELPCAITDMEPKDQIATMLLENMQRNDLTIYEQAKGFQLMMDLGDTIEAVSEKSGFSQSTIRRRVKLLELDEEKFKKSEARNVSLFEYMELDKIKDIERKNKVLDSIGTENFNNELKKAIEYEEKQAYFDEVEAEVSKFAIKIEDRSGYSWETDYGTWNKKKVVVPEDADTVQYYYRRGDSYVTIYTKNEETPVDEEAERLREEKEADKDRRKGELKEITKRAYELRSEAVKTISNSHATKHLADIVAFILEMTGKYYIRADEGDILNILDINIDSEEFEDWADEEITDYIFRTVKTEAKAKPGVILLRYAYSISEDSENKGYYDSWTAKHDTDSRLDMIYDFLCKLGYEMSDEEKALRDGTHELFITEES